MNNNNNNNYYYQKEISEWENDELIHYLYSKNYNILLELCKKFNLNGYDLFFINEKSLKEDFNVFNFHERHLILKLIKYLIHNQLKITFTSNKTGEKISIILTNNSPVQLKDFTSIISNIFKLNPNNLIFRDFKGKEILSPTNNVLDLIIEFPFKYKEINVVNCNDLNEINNNDFYNLNEINNENLNFDNEILNDDLNKEKKVIKHNYSFDNNLERKKNTVNLLSKKISNLDTKINDFKNDNNNNIINNSMNYNDEYFNVKYKTRNNSNNSKIINTNSNLTNFTNNNNNNNNSENINYKQMSLTPKSNKFFHFKNKNYTNNNNNQFNNIYNNNNNKTLDNNHNNYYTNENINYNNINNHIYNDYKKNKIIKSERVFKHERKKFNKINNNNYLINDLNNNYQTKIINNNNNQYLNNENINYNNNNNFD